MLINKRRRKQAVLLATTSAFAFTAVFSGVGSAFAQVKGVSSVATVTTNTTVAAAKTIAGTAENPVAVALTGATLTNEGTIRGFANSSAIVVTGVASADTKIINSGTIEASKTSGNNARDVAAIFLASRADIINKKNGIIRGTGGADGIIVATDVANGANGAAGGSTITNEEGGTISSDSGNAISVYGPMRSITNSGKIISDTGTAIYIGAKGAITESITNTSTGLIQGGAADGSGKAIDASLSTANLTINNAGQIVGQILFGSGTDTLNITGGSITGNVSGDSKDTVNFDLGTGSFTTGGKFVGIGTINAKSGTTTLAQAVTGATAFTIGSGAKLKQRAAIASTTVTNSGTLDVGSSKQTITGNYVQNSTGVLAVTITDAAAGSLSVSGTANVAGKVAPNTLSRTNAVTPGTSFTVLESTGTLTVAASTSVDGTNSIEKFALSQSGNLLKITREFGIAPDAPVQKAIDAIKSGTISTGGSESVAATTVALEKALGTLVDSTGGVQARIDKVGATTALGSILSILQSSTVTINGTTVQLTQDQVNDIVSQFVKELTPDFTISATSAGVTNAIGSASTTTVNNRVASMRSADSQTGIAAGDAVGRGIDLWAQPFLSTFAQSMKDGVSGFKADSRGVTVGADTVVADNLRVGLAVGYANTDIDGKNASTGDSSEVDSYQATLYASYSPAPWYLDAQLGYGFNKNDQTRKFSVTQVSSGFSTIENLKADYDSSSYRARLAGGLTKTFGGVELTPNLFLQYVYAETDSYKESGSNGASMASSDTTSIQGGIGLRIAYPMAVEGGRLIPELRVGYTREFNADAPSTNFSMVNIPELSSTVTGAKPSQNIYNVGLGLTFLATEKLSISGNYEYQGTDSSDGHVGYLRVKYKF
jgi:outer membrane autotransporter protein